VKNRGKILIYNLIKTFPYFFTGRKLRPPNTGIEATALGPPAKMSFDAFGA